MKDLHAVCGLGNRSLIAAESSAVFLPTLARERLRSLQKVWPPVSIMCAYFFHPSGAGCSEGEVRVRWDFEQFAFGLDISYLV